MQYANLGKILEGRIFLTKGYVTEEPPAIHHKKKLVALISGSQVQRAIGFSYLVKTLGVLGEQWHF